MKNWREKGRMIRSKEKEKQAGRKTATAYAGNVSPHFLELRLCC
jgi:hypothetical protein